MTLSSPINELKGVSDKTAQKFAILGIIKINDLINHFPRRYEDFSNISNINKIKPGPTSLKVKIKNQSGRYVRRGLHITEAIASDSTGSLRLIWFNQPYRANSISSNTEYYLSGNYELSKSRFVIINPSIEAISDFPKNTARILAIYRETKGLDSRQIRLALAQTTNLINELEETLPSYLLNEYNLLNRNESIYTIHLPNTTSDINAAQKRLGFEEVFCLSLAAQLNKQENKKQTALPVPFKEDLAKKFVKNLPFKLTNGQRLATWQIYKDMQRNEPMNRLIEGDVGSGKTVVAAMASLMVMANNQQVAFMAPTELLARQHADSLYNLLMPIQKHNYLTLLTGSLNASQKKSAYNNIKTGKLNLIIGTQALIADKVDMHDLALIIIDEQHRFGVEQRKKLMLKAGYMPHVLSLSATPIPRSLALTLYGELDISKLTEKPFGRHVIKSDIIHPSEVERLYKNIDEEINKGRQVFVVCPSINESKIIDISAVETEYIELKKSSLRHLKIALLHGKLSNLDKIKVMDDFIAKKIDILVCTTVIEVGVDVPNATIMLIKSPERFGLAQLHQLRGRVGRGDHQGYCYLLLDKTDNIGPRLKAFISSTDGFKLADLDLKLRGPGSIYGTMQHGALDLRIAQLSDLDLITNATKAAKKFIERNENLLKYKQLALKVNKLRTITNLN